MNLSNCSEYFVVIFRILLDMVWFKFLEVFNLDDGFVIFVENEELICKIV